MVTVLWCAGYVGSSQIENGDIAIPSPGDVNAVNFWARPWGNNWGELAESHLKEVLVFIELCKLIKFHSCIHKGSKASCFKNIPICQVDRLKAQLIAGYSCSSGFFMKSQLMTGYAWKQPEYTRKRPSCATSITNLSSQSPSVTVGWAFECQKRESSVRAKVKPFLRMARCLKKRNNSKRCHASVLPTFFENSRRNYHYKIQQG